MILLNNIKFMKARIFIKSYNNWNMQIATVILNEFLLKSGFSLSSGFVSLPTVRKRFCILRSPHVDKDSREHFELQIHKKFIDITVNNLKNLETLLATKLPQGVSTSLQIIN